MNWAINLGYLQSTHFPNSTIYNQTPLYVIYCHILIYTHYSCGLTINHTIRKRSVGEQGMFYCNPCDRHGWDDALHTF